MGEVIKALLELIDRFAFGNAKGSKQNEIHCDNFAKSVRVGAPESAGFYLYFFSPRAACNQPNCCRLRQTYHMEMDLPSVRGNWVVPFECFCAGIYYGCVLQCNLGLAWPVTIVYVVSVLLVQTFRWDCVGHHITGVTCHRMRCCS